MTRLSKHTRNEENIYRNNKRFTEMTENEKIEYYEWMERRGLWDGDVIMQNIDRMKVFGNK